MGSENGFIYLQTDVGNIKKYKSEINKSIVLKFNTLQIKQSHSTRSYRTEKIKSSPIV